MYYYKTRLWSLLPATLVYSALPYGASLSDLLMEVPTLLCHKLSKN